jgi:hypothetical protein
MATYLPGPNPEAESRVSAPAIAIVVVSGLAIAWSLLNLLMQLLGVGAGMFGRGGGSERFAQMMGSTIGLVLGLIGLVLYVVAIVGALKMKNLQSYGLSLASAVIVMLPCSCCCLAGLPVGIWALVVLMNDQVKAAFRT